MSLPAENLPPLNGARGDIAGLPHGLGVYLRTPGLTLQKVTGWLRARWQLRSCTSVGSWPRTCGRVYVRNMGRIIVGDRVHFTSVFGPSLLTAYPDSVLEVGDRTVINHTADISATNLVRIGSDCMIGTNVIILDNDFHDLVDRGRTPTGKPVIIGNGAWIGNRVTILPGVTIGEEAAIGAGSVVMTDIPPRSLALGNPARVIKRF